MAATDRGEGIIDITDTPPQPPPSSRSRQRTPRTYLVGIGLPLGSLLLLWQTFAAMAGTELPKLLVAAIAIVVGVGGTFLLYVGLDRFTYLLPADAQDTARAWFFVGPALAILGLALVYPAVYTLLLSFRDASGDTFVGLDNYAFIFTDEGTVRSIRNTAIWIVVVPAVSVVFGLGVAVMSDRLHRLENVAKSLIFLPMAVSFVGASVVWGFIYDFKVFGNQTGLLNGIYTGLTGNDPVAWLSSVPWNNLFLMVIMIWMMTGFAMVVLSGAIKGVPEDILEAARIDGATEWQVFSRVTIPSIMSSIVVVTTTMVIMVLKVFDIVFVTTNGESGTEVIAEQMIRWFFRNDNDGRGAAIAMILLISVIPVMIANIRRFRAEEEMR